MQRTLQPLIERRISNPPLQVYRALSGGKGDADCVHEQVAKADCECPLY